MAQITIATDDIGEARMLLDALDDRSGTPAPAPTGDVVSTSGDGADQVDDNEVDSNGMKWNADIHTSTRAQNADGSWKARKGKAQEAKDAVAAFKASGGNVEPPADVPTQEPAMPAAGGMPAAQRDMPPPISQAMLEEKIIGMINRGTLLQDPEAAIGAAAANTYQGLLDAHQVSRDDPTSVLSTNETLRAAIYAACCQIEPELA